MESNSRNDSLMTQVESEKIELYFSISYLEADVIYLQIFSQEGKNPRKILLKTKPASPYKEIYDFSDPLVVDFSFQVRQRIIVQVFDARLSHRILLGTTEATLGEIYNGRGEGIQKVIDFQGGRRGFMNFRGEKIEKTANKFIQFTLTAHNIRVEPAFICCGEKGFNWKLYKLKDHKELLLYQSEVKLGKNVSFNPIRINQKKLCNNNPKQPIIFKCFQDSGSVLIGEAMTDLYSVKNGKYQLQLHKKGQQKGIILLQNYKQTIKYDFTDFLGNGMQMAMVICIDFTASNGIQNSPKSLHYTTHTTKSKYEQALFEVCNIVLDYDTDKLVPTFGFGAKINLPHFHTQGKVHHCFPINGSSQNPNLYQVQGIVEGYRKILPHLSFSGPTLFAPLLKEAMSVCQKMKNEIKEYMILMILTDGVLNDKNEVKNLLVKCGRLPLSIIIIGIGNENWDDMRDIDDNDCVITDSQGNKTMRDLVQFVQYAKYNNGVDLARQVLGDLPRQVEEYHRLVGLTPQDYNKNLSQDVLYQKQNSLA